MRSYTSDMVSNAPSVHDQIALGLKEHPAKKGLPFNILVTAIEIGGSHRIVPPRSTNGRQ